MSKKALGILAGVVFFALTSLTRAADSEGIRIAKALSSAYQEIVEKVSPAVVTIETEKRGAVEEEEFNLPPGLPPQFRDFFRGRPNGPRQYKSQGMGSGFVIDKDGLILTNNHVVEEATKIKVILADGAEVSAVVVGADSKTDIAIVRLKDADKYKITALPLGDSDKIKPGNVVIAIGAPFGLKQTVTCGIVSATNRNRLGQGELRSIMYQDFIQTDATINPGNSGGPLVNLDGEVVGINAAISTTSGGSEGVGFSIPINMVKTIKEELIKNGSITRGYLGVGIRDIDATMKKAMPELKGGAYILQTYPNTPATEGGVQIGDIVIKYDGTEITDVSHLQNLVAQTAIDKKVKITVLRGGKEQELTITIKKQPKNLAVSDDDSGGGDADSNSGDTSEKYHSDILGMDLIPLSAAGAEEKRAYSDAKGLVIVGVDKDGAAERADLQRGTLIMLINQTPVTTIDEFKKIETSLKGKEAALLLCRLGKQNAVISLELNNPPVK